ncbi:MAG: HAMP domain-containing sensor histidine kinase [Eubacteriales bacterium]|nr:HAMP domain-containing sensor histidine kinase [Eubacteriales bacterium]
MFKKSFDKGADRAKKAGRIFSLRRFFLKHLSLILYALGTFIILLIFTWLFYLPSYVIGYGALLLFAALIAFLALEYYRERKLLSWLRDFSAAAQNLSLESLQDLSNSEYLLISASLKEWERIAELRREMRESQSAYQDYFALWLHRMKTPLAVLKLHLESAGLERQNLIDSKLNEVERYANLALVYVNLQDSERSLELERFDLADLLESLIKRLEAYAEAQQVKVELELEGLKIHADRLRLSLAIEQFLVNAYKYGHGQSVEVKIEAGKLRIQDHGPGIPEYLLPRVQSRGFAGSQGELRYQSSGLGLYLARRLLADMGLDYILISAPGEGCEVQIDFHDIIA